MRASERKTQKKTEKYPITVQILVPSWILHMVCTCVQTHASRKKNDREISTNNLVIINRAIGIDALKIFQFKLAKSRLHALFVFNFTSAYLRFSFVLFRSACSALFLLVCWWCVWVSSAGEYSTWLRISVREKWLSSLWLMSIQSIFSGISGLSKCILSFLWTVNVVYFRVTMMIKLNKRQTNKEQPTDRPAIRMWG